MTQEELVRWIRKSLLFSSLILRKAKRWKPVSVEDEALKNVNNYVPLQTIESKSSERRLLCKECEEVVFFVENQEIWNTKDSGRNGEIILPAGVSATIYKGRYSIV